MSLVSVLEVLLLLPAAGFLLAAVALPIATLRLADETTDDLRSVRRRTRLRSAREWPDRPAAIWYRGIFAMLVGSWATGILLIIVVNVFEALQ